MIEPPSSATVSSEITIVKARGRDMASDEFVFMNERFGTLINTTARVHKLTLLTTDSRLKGYAHANVHHFSPIGKRRCPLRHG